MIGAFGLGRCDVCGERLTGPVVYGRPAVYGPDAPWFCSEEHLDAWAGTMQARSMALGVVFRELGANIAAWFDVAFKRRTPR